MADSGKFYKIKEGDARGFGIETGNVFFVG
jgi:hypothetical protein